MFYFLRLQIAFLLPLSLDISLHTTNSMSKNVGEFVAVIQWSK